jgi:multidrug efflux pump subunit AcrA (membrane-fusion protein)
MAANLAESRNLADRLAAIPRANGGGQTWREIDQLVEELAALAQADVSRETFYAALLDKALAALAASGGAVWQLAVNRPATVLAQINFPPTLTSSANTSERWRAALDQEATVLFAPRGSGNSASTTFLSETPLVVSWFRDTNGTATIIEIVLAHDLPPETLQGTVRLVEVFREVAVEFGRGRELAMLRQRGADLRQFDEFVLRLHDSLDLVSTAYAIANDGRLWIGCDRVSVARVDNGQARVLAVSGVDQVDRRGAEVGGLERLAAAVAVSNEPLVWPENPSRELPPQLDHALQAHLDVAHARRLIVAPLCRRGVKEADEEHAIRGIVIAESFDERLDSNLFRERTHDVARHGGTALLAALTHHDLPLLPLQVKIGQLLRIMRQRRVALLLTVAFVVAVAGLLAVVPADFSIEVRGTLQPKVRRHLFAPADGVVESVLVEHGANVAQGEPLLLLRDPRLDLDYSRVSGELQTAQARLAAVQARRSSRNIAPDAREEARQLAAEEEQLKEQVRGLDAQQRLLGELRNELRVASPIRGVVLTWNATDTLQDRPVKQGQLLVTVADPTSPWVLELRVPDADVGHLLAAQRRGRSALPVSFLLATDPAVTHEGEIERVALATDIAGDDSPGALTVVRLAKEPPSDARAGISVTARIHCGRKPIGYVWLHDLIDAIRTQVFF